jgi:sugar phosphate isomerase/epimerase
MSMILRWYLPDSDNSAIEQLLNRRSFLGTAISGLVVSSSSKLLGESSMTRLGPIGLQLYTVREEMKKDAARTIAAVASAGYKQVEFAGYFDHSPKDIRKMLDDNGLSSPSAHIQMSDLGEPWERMLDAANTIGHEYLVCGWIDEPDRTVAGYEKIAARFNSAAEKSVKRGVMVGYHNYSYDFTRIDGEIPYEILLRECDPKRVVMEMDVFWVRAGGGDPIAYLDRNRGRFRMLHAKDMGPAPKNEMQDVGKGVIDWRAILKHGREAGVKYVFVEHDEPKNPWTSIRNSYSYLHALDF